MEQKPQIEEEINFRDVIRNPKRWFGLIYPYFFVIILIGGYYFVDHLSIANQNDVAPALPDSANVFIDVKPTKAKASQGVDIKQMLKPDEAMISKGKSLFQANCSSCHGTNGMGDGPAGAALNPKPRNFHAAEGWKNGRRVADMFQTLQKGIPGSGMPAFEYLPASDRLDIISYVRTFANDFPKPSEQELSDLDKTFNLSKGTQAASQIPVSEAISAINSEALPRMQNIYSVLSYINNNAGEPGSRIFNAVSSNKLRSLVYLSSSEDWKSSQNDFIRTVTSNTDVNGFIPAVVNLSSKDWNDLYRYLLSSFSKRS
ncbi:MAG: cytochrome c [Ignavibacteria bacterium]|jgi:mono/diheme cytochrome c family protein|nr:cytochrome c [Ignavibacteria bacterium]MCU7503923.1 cytochrome c [Ignavibacteria bacterium]MCU7515856.1 cytochrome c [Ignavibacteria bacterium]